MRKSRTVWFILLLVAVFLSGCAQEKVMDTEFIRLQNKVKDLENIQKQKENEIIRINQSLTDIEQQLKAHSEQLQNVVSHTNAETAGERHPVIIQDVKISSEKMDDQGRIWGPFDLTVTLYNGIDVDMKDQLVAVVITESADPAQPPQIQTVVQPYEVKAKESGVISLKNIPISDPTRRLNVVIKIMEQSVSPAMNGIAGKVTWVIAPKIIFPPKE